MNYHISQGAQTTSNGHGLGNPKRIDTLDIPLFRCIVIYVYEVIGSPSFTAEVRGRGHI